MSGKKFTEHLEKNKMHDKDVAILAKYISNAVENILGPKTGLIEANRHYDIPRKHDVNRIAKHEYDKGISVILDACVGRKIEGYKNPSESLGSLVASSLMKELKNKHSLNVEVASGANTSQTGGGYTVHDSFSIDVFFYSYEAADMLSKIREKDKAGVAKAEKALVGGVIEK